MQPLFIGIETMLARWKQRTSDRQKLQHTYALVALVLLMIAGIFGLFNDRLGEVLLEFAGYAAILFAANAVAWALLQSFVLLRISEPKKSTKR